jgi:hypothetical protein
MPRTVTPIGFPLYIRLILFLNYFLHIRHTYSQNIVSRKKNKFVRNKTQKRKERREEELWLNLSSKLIFGCF